MKQFYLKMFSFNLILCLQLFSVSSFLSAEPISHNPDNSVIGYSGMNVLTNDSGVRVTQSREVTISMEKETYGGEKNSKDDEGLLNANFDDLDDPFADELPEYPPIEDPFEGYNRIMFDVNDKFYTYLMKPIATGYGIIVPEGVRGSIKNLFANFRSPVNFLSSLIQGDLDKSGRVLGRMIINTTIGVGGLFDVAKTHFDIKPVNEDFDQALGYHGVPNGPYIVLPILGPSSGRNTVGSAVDILLNPTAWVSPSFGVGTGINFTNITNETSFKLDAYDDLKDSAVDPYVSLRDFNHQYREGLVHK